MATYAQKTKVPVAQSRNEIEQTLVRYGAKQFVFGYDEHRAVIGFSMADRQVRFHLPIHGLKPQQERQRWRALLLVVKSKLESVESGIETFEEAFLPHIVLPDGQLFKDWAVPQIEQAYETGKMPPLLPAPRGD